MYRIELTSEQSDFVSSNAKHTAFVGGFGSGKTMSICTKLLMYKLRYPDLDFLYVAPTNSLIREIFSPYMSQMLQDCNMGYYFNKSEHIMYVDGHRGRIICKSGEVAEKIVGFQCAGALIDEIDIMKPDRAELVFNKTAARIRQKFPDKTKNFLDMASTPEGFGFLWKVTTRSPLPGLKLIRARTDSNPHLPEDYVDSLKAIYPANLISAYLEGNFVNLTSGSVYASFNRNVNHATTKVSENEMLYIGMDFNVERMAAVVAVLRMDGDDKKMYIIGEFHNLLDTPTMIESIIERYPNNSYTVHPDAAGQSRTTKNITLSDHQLLKNAGFKLKAYGVNPRIKDRVRAVNSGFMAADGNTRVYVDTDSCPRYTEAIEGQVWKDGLPDKGQMEFDQINDAGGYLINWHFPSVRKSFGTTVVNMY